MSTDSLQQDDQLVVCEFCGMLIEEEDQQCAALADGECEP